MNETLFELGLSHTVAVLAPALTYPVNTVELVDAITKSSCERIVVVEDLESFLELQIAQCLVHEGIGCTLSGKDIFPSWGPLTYEQVKAGLAHMLANCSSEDVSPEDNVTDDEESTLPLVHREGTFCPGCPHRMFFDALLDVINEEDIIGGDIGCSSLPPHYSDCSHV